MQSKRGELVPIGEAFSGLRTPRPEPPFPLVSSASFGSARSSPGREAAKRTLDGEDRSDTMKREGKGGGFHEQTPRLRFDSEPSRRDK